MSTLVTPLANVVLAAAARAEDWFLTGELFGFKFRHTLHQRHITIGISRVLIAGEECLAPRTGFP